MRKIIHIFTWLLIAPQFAFALHLHSYDDLDEVSPPPIILTGISVTDTCSLGLGSIDITVSGGTPPFTYNWSNGGTTEDQANLVGDITYTVTVEDATGTTQTLGFILPNITFISVFDMNFYYSPVYYYPNTSCTTTANGGWEWFPITSLPFSWNWSNGVMTANNLGLSSGDYFASVTLGTCENVIHYVLQDIPNEPDVSANPTPATCGQPNGAIDLTATNGEPPYTFAWSNGADTEDISGLSPGTYSVTVTGSNGCTATGSWPIADVLPFTISGTATPSTGSPPNGSVDITVTPPGSYAYTWSNGEATEDISGLASGTYTVTATDASGCTATASFDVAMINPPPLVITGTVMQDTCGLGLGAIDITVSDGTPPYSYLWSNGATSEDLTNLANGIFSVTVTDASGTTATYSATVNSVSVDPVFIYNVMPDTMCWQTSTGSINMQLVIPSNGTFNFAWSNGASGPTLTMLEHGDYTVTITFGTCVDEQVINVPGYYVIPGISSVVTDASCGLANGSIDVTPVAAIYVGPYTFMWSNGATTEDISGLSPGSYTVTIIGSNNCSSWSIPIEVGDENPPIQVDGDITPSTDCQGNGSITVSSPPPGPYNYVWSNGGAGNTISGLLPGSYTVTVTSTGTCTDTETFIVPDMADIPAINLSPISSECGLANGQVTTLVTGGAQPYQYSWSNGGTTGNIENIISGTYSLTVTDDLGCSAAATVTVSNELIPIDITADATPNTNCGNTPNGSISIAANPPYNYTYAWSNGANQADITNLPAGTYTVTVTAYGNCTETAIITVPNQLNQPTVEVDGTPSSCGFNNGTATAIVSNGEPPFDYVWSNGNATASVSNLAPSNYTVLVSDLNACTVIGTIDILNENIPVQITGTIQPNSDCDVPNGLIALSLDPPGNFNFIWSNGQNTQDISGITTGTYSVTVSSGGNCTTSSNFFVPNMVIPDTVLQFGTSCNPADVGTTQQLFTNTNGCDSLVITTIVFSASDTTAIFGTSCNPSDVGTTQQLYTNSNGCDSLVVTTIAYSASDTTDIFGTSCNPADVGTTQQLFTNQNGCDSLVITTIAYAASDTTAIFGTSCNPVDVGTTQQLFTNQNGCDSLVITTIAFSTSDTTAIFGTSCNPADVGTTQQLFTNQNGCDSLVVTTIAYSASDTTDIFGTSCNPADVGTSQQLFTNSNGCDSLVVKTIAYSASDTTAIFGTSCNPADVGTTQQLFTNSNGCDSLVVTTIAYSSSDTTAIFGTSCNPADVGTTQQLFTNQNGCDSLVVTTIAYSASDTTAIFGTSCNPADVGVTQQLFTNANGCDSLVVTTIAYSASDTTAIFGTSCNPADVGTSQQLFNNANGCDSLIVTTIGYSASDTTAIFGTSCNPADVGTTQQLFTNSNGCDSLVVTTIAFSASDTTAIFGTSCNPTDVGTTQQLLTNSNGCDSLVVTTISLLPSTTTSLAATTCDPTQAGIFIQNLSTWQGCDSTVTTVVTLLPSATTSLTSTTCDPAQAGIFTQNLNTWQGCDSTVTTTVALLPSATTLLTATTCDATQAGTFTQNLSTWQGCDSTVTTTVTWSPPPVLALTASDFNGFGVSCEGAADGWAQASASGIPPFGYSWQNGQAQPLLEGLAPGPYAVTVTDGNGCTASAFVELAGPEPLMLSLAVTGLDCFDNSSGGTFATAMGGVPPYDYRLRPVGNTGGSFQPSGSFGGLGAGAYEVSVLDANGCSASELVAINTPVPLSVELGEDIFIELGDGTSLGAVASVPWDSLAQVDWSGIGEVECPACPGQQVYPLVTTAYSITVVDGQGCLASDGLTVYVDRTKSVYVPNAFSPNGDGINDLLTVFAKPGQVERIRSFQVFDRWGESVYRYFDFQPDDPAAGWDGAHRGQPLNTAVFVWFAEVEFVDGTSALLKGDVVLVR